MSAASFVFTNILLSPILSFQLTACEVAVLISAFC